LISEGNNRIIAYGNPDLLHKSGGRPKAAPTASQGHFREQQLAKPKFDRQSSFCGRPFLLISYYPVMLTSK